MEERSKHKAELATLQSKIDRLLPTFVRLSGEPIRDREFNEFRICANFRTDFVHEILIHGNDRQLIEYIAGSFAHEVERQLTTINFQRLMRGELRNETRR